MHAESPGFVRSRAYDRAIAAPGHDDGLAAQLRIITLLNGGVKRVHVYVDDFPHYELEKYIRALSIQEPRVCLF